MSRARFNSAVFLLEGMNAFATGFYINYLFFYLKHQFGFSNTANLLVCALNGLIFIPSALYGGRFGQKRGYITALAIGCVLMAISLGISAVVSSIPALMLLMCTWTLGMCFTWPNLEALICDKEQPRNLPRLVGVYNVVWSGGAAMAYFTGGAIAEAAGWRSIFWVPALIHLLQAGLTFGLRRRWEEICARTVPKQSDGLHEAHPEGPAFLKMAWLANPFAYIAINAAIPLIPDLAQRLALSPKYAGFFCSIWFFSRTFTFVILAMWEGWHYKFRHLVLAYAGVIVCFALMLLAAQLWFVVLVQIAFGWCLGLIYYSSLYYSMHVGETKGEHGGVHEAAIGAGIFGGPAIGAASLYLFPAQPNSGVYGVVVVLVAGLGALLLVRQLSKRATSAVSGRNESCLLPSDARK